MFQKFAEKAAKITNMKWMRILTNGFMSVAAVSICGSIFSLIKSIPITPYQNFLTSSGLGDILSIPVTVCSDFMALYIVLAMGYTVAKEFGQKNPFAPAVVSLGAFLVLTPTVASSVTGIDEAGNYIISTVTGAVGTSVLGAQGIFLAILCGLCASRFYILLIEKNIRLKLPDAVPDNVSGMFEMMIPGGITFLVFLVLRWVVALTPFGTMQDLIYTILQAPLLAVSGGLAGALLYITVAKFLWVFGVHGGMVAYSALAAVMGTAMAANASAFAAGTAAPYPEWAWTTMLMDFSILPMAIALLIVARSSQYKALAKVALPTAVFNISEPLIFGIPVIMNPVLAIPFVLLQPVNMLLTLLVQKIGILATPTGVGVSNVLPSPIGMAFTNAHWSGAVWGILLMALDIIVWIPFLRIVDRKAQETEAAAETITA